MKRRYLIHYVSTEGNFEGRTIAQTPKPIRTCRDIQQVESDLNESRDDKIIIIGYTQMHK